MLRGLWRLCCCDGAPQPPQPSQHTGIVGFRRSAYFRVCCWDVAQGAQHTSGRTGGGHEQKSISPHTLLRGVWPLACTFCLRVVARRSNLLLLLFRLFRRCFCQLETPASNYFRASAGRRPLSGGLVNHVATSCSRMGQRTSRLG